LWATTCVTTCVSLVKTALAMKRIIGSLGLITLCWLIGSCGDSPTGPPPPPPPPTTAVVVMSATTSTLVPSQTLQLSATAKDISGQVLSRTFAWSSSDAAKATVSSSGMVSGVAPGTATITAEVDGKSATTTITVLDGGVVSSTGTTLSLMSGGVQIIVPDSAVLTPINISVVPSTAFATDPRVVKGTPFDFGPAGTTFAKPITIKIKYDRANLPQGTEEAALQIHLSVPGWQSVESSTVDTAGKVVTAQVSHFSTYAILTPMPVASVDIRAPPGKTIIGGVSTLVAGETEQLTAALADALGQPLGNRAITWATSNATIATITSGGLVTAINPGSTTISATAGGLTSSITVTVTPVPVSSVAVALTPQTVTVGQTSQAAAVLKDSKGAVLTGRSILWASDNSGVASVNPATGLITAVAPGSATISATSEAQSGTATITVTPAPVAAVTVSLANSSINAVETTQASASLVDANGTALTGRTITWSSDNTGVATVSPAGLVTAVSTGTANIVATSEGKTGTAPVTITPAPVASVTVAPPSGSLVEGSTLQLSAETRDAKGRLITGRFVSWSTDAHGIATVSATGLVTAVAPGTANITAESENKIGMATINVTAIPVATVSVSLATSTVIAGQTTQATATTLDGSGNTLTGRVVVWSSDNATVATVSSTGLVTSHAAGVANIIAVSETKTGGAALTVDPVPVNTVAVSPPTATVIVSATQQLTATTKDINDNTLTGRVVTWSSSDPTRATVSSTGLVTAVAAGPAVITATSEGKTGTSSITVTPVAVASVTVSLTPNSITAVGTSQAAAVTLDANGAVLTGRAISWSSSNTAVATVSPQGVVSAVAQGTADIIAISEGKTNSAVLTVTPAPVATVTVSPPSATVFQSATEQLTVVLKDAHNNVLSGRSIVWSSSNVAVATVSTSGLVTAASATMGTVTITATSEGQIGTSSITVSQDPVASVSVALSLSTINVGQNTQASATLRDASNNILTGRTVTWTSDNTTVATVSTGGVVTALAAGTAHIFGASGGQSGSATLTVTPIPVASVSVSLAASPIQIGQSTQATATTRDANNGVLTGRVIVWSSDNTGVATVTTGGLVTAIGAGSANIIAASEGQSGSSPLTVIAVPVASLTLSAPTTPMVLGQTQQLTAIPKDASGNTLAGRTVNWVSSNPAVLTVSAASSVSNSGGATVTLTAAGLGTATITATSESAPSVATPVITVNPIPVATVTVSPSSAALALGVTSTQQLTAILKDLNNNTLTGRTVTWTSSNPSVASVDGNGFVTAVGGGSTTITATSETKTGTSSITVTVPVMTVAVSPSSATLTVGLTHQLIATTKDVNGSVLTGRLVTWTSSNAGVAAVDANGLVSAVAAGGPVTITATSEGKSGTSAITVTPISVASVSVSLSASTIQVGQTTQATATTFDASNNVLTGRVATWSTGNPAVATVSPSGLVTATGVGSTTITATSEGTVGSASLTVIAVPVGSVTVTPGSATLISGITQQLSAETRDANNVVVTDRPVTWSSSNTAIATVNSAGLVTAVSVGGATITATSEGKSGTSSITVIPVPVGSVTVSLSPNSITAVGTSQATATTFDGNGGTLTGRIVTWSSSNSAVATVSAQGVVTAVSVGTASIIATSEGKTGNATITVTPAPVATVTVSPTSAIVVQGGTEQLSVTLNDAHGNVLTRPMTWSSSSDAVATVSQSGLVSAISSGTATITATSEGQSGTSSLTVSPIPVASVIVTLASSTITDAQTTQATAVDKDADGNVLTGRTISWSSDNTAVATVSPTGVVSAVAAGSTQIRATSGGQTGSAPLTVIPRVAAVIVSPSSANVIIGNNLQLAAETRDANSNVLTGRTVTWSSSAPSIATVSASGLVTSVALGSVTITATSEGKAGTSSISVVPVPVAIVTVSLASTSITVGQGTQATATTRDSTGAILNGRSVTWTSGNNAVATVSSTGLVTSVSSGSVQIVATSEGKTGSATLTVIPAPVATVTLSGPVTPMVVGNTQVLTALPKDAGGNTLTGRTVNWVSSNTAVLTVSAASSVSTASGATITVTAAGAGTATITATSESAPGATTPVITVNPVPVATVTVAPTTASLVLGITPTQQLSAVTKDLNGIVLTGRLVTWTSSNPAAATVDGNGLVTAVGAGATTITATSETKTGASSITVTLAPVNSVTVTPVTASLVIGIAPTQQLTAVTKDANGTVLTGRLVTWTSSNVSAATVDANGLVTAVGAGATTVTATSETKTGTSSVTVTVAPVNTVTVTPASASMVVGITPPQQLTVTLKDVNGNVLTDRMVTWTSSDATAATVDANGLVTAVGAGVATITATSETKTGTSSITVTLAPVATVTLSPTSASLVLGITPPQQLTPTLRDAANNVLTGRVIAWTSSNPAAATVDDNGLVTAVGAGATTITATSETQAGTASITVTLAPVNTVTVAPLSATVVLVITPTQQLTATLRDAANHVLTGRTVTWTSSNTALATVDGNGLVTAVAAGGPVTITATSETKTGTSSITVTVPPVASVTVTPSSAALLLGVIPSQQLTATTKDAHGNTLAGRIVTWSSDNNGVATVSSSGFVAAIGAGTATITALSEGVPGTASITVTVPSNFASVLHASATNGRYFENASGQSVYLTGSHTWSNLQDNGTSDPPSSFNYTAYLNFLESYHHNFFRLWAWEQSKWTGEFASDYWIAPGPFLRTGPDTALDGKPKFDLSQFNQAYFDRLRSRVQDAGARGIYVSVMLFDGWSVGQKDSDAPNNPWKGHPFNAANNVNAIDGDTNGDGQGFEVQTLGNSAVTAYQDAYVRKVIDAVGDLDNVLYEIDNEGDPSSRDWQYHMIQVIRNYETKHHPIGMTSMYPVGSEADLTGSSADWISLQGSINPIDNATGSKVLIADTDHICGICGSTDWVWKTFAKGLNPILMDGYDGAAIGLGAEDYTASDPVWELIRKNMGYARDYALRLDLKSAVPHGDLVLSESIGYCLAKPGSQYLVYLPNGGSVTLNLSAVAGSLTAEWLNPVTGEITQVAAPVVANGSSSVTVAAAPFSGPSVLFLH
jgi:uncharacterized protein YjdB